MTGRCTPVTAIARLERHFCDFYPLASRGPTTNIITAIGLNYVHNGATTT